MTRHGIISVLLLSMFAAMGCEPPHPPLSTILPVEAVVTEYNANAVRVPRLWARAEITYKESAAALPISTTGLLALHKGDDPTAPTDFFLKFSEAGNEIGRLGVSTADEAYYVWFQVGDRQSCRWGRLSLAGAPGIQDMPIDPTQLLAVLTICELPTGQTAPPFVAQRIEFDPCAYVLTYVDRQPITGRFLFQREVFLRWAVDAPRRAFRVNLLDERGLPILSAELHNYQPIALEDVNDTTAPAPIMPTDIRMTWRKTGGELRLKLSKMTTADKVDPEAYLFGERLPKRLRYQARQVDAHLPLQRPKATKGTPTP